MGALPRSAMPVPAPAGTPGYLAGLNPEQLAAVTAQDGPLLVLAGAGTGKTRVLTTRLAHILLTGRARPPEVLAVTFTNRAAREMAERVEHLVGGSVAGMWLGTFHAMGARMLRIHAELVGLQPSFTILDADDQQRLAKQVLQAADLDERRWPARLLVGIIQRWKDRGYRPDQVPAADAGEFALGRGVELYRAYQQRLATLNACDFGDLLLHCLTLLTDHPDVLAQYQRRFRAILVDEYQDTNVAQYLWLRLLAAGHKNVTCVGDDDQSIYSWRGAEVGNILRFEQDFPGAHVIRLERNYRSTGHILGAASGVIARNRARHGKTLWTEGEAGEPVRVAGLWDDQEEARFVADEIEAWQRNGGKSMLSVPLRGRNGPGRRHQRPHQPSARVHRDPGQPAGQHRAAGRRGGRELQPVSPHGAARLAAQHPLRDQPHDHLRPLPRRDPAAHRRDDRREHELQDMLDHAPGRDTGRSWSIKATQSQEPRVHEEAERQAHRERGGAGGDRGQADHDPRRPQDPRLSVSPTSPRKRGCAR